MGSSSLLKSSRTVSLLGQDCDEKGQPQVMIRTLAATTKPSFHSKVI